MQLVNFSVTNYRSITKAHKINLQNITVLVGKRQILRLPLNLTPLL